MRICVVGDAEDLSAAYVAWLAERRGVNVLTLPEDRLGLAWTFRLTGSGGAIQAGGETYDVRAIDGAFVRLNPRPSVDGALGVPVEFEHVYAIERRHAIQWLLDEAPFPVVNRPSSGRANGSKPFQMAELAGAGLPIPRWVVTNDVRRARAFIESCPDGAVYKSCSGLRSHVRRADAALLERLAAATAPVVLQEYVGGTDVRVHVVGDETFGTAVESAALDYRFESEQNEYSATTVPPDVARLCVEATRRERLVLAGLDFRVSPDGAWWCLELNPVPTFLPYEAGSSHAIGEAILDALVGREHEGRRPSRLAAITEP
jgi:glutathione synthase/RimK-type ligase-like ATP-grasp enzyme